MPFMPMRRKKWTEEEEEALITKYGELLQSGFLSKAKSRERKFEPMAAHVNALFHAQHPAAYPWLWSWKDASTKVQNMRHQYLGVKQKIKNGGRSSIDPAADYEWGDGLSVWANFLKYKAVFGDKEVDANEYFTTQTTTNPDYSLPHHLHIQPEHQHVSVHPHQHLTATHSPSLPLAHSTSFPSESNFDGAIHSLSKSFSDTGDGLENSNAGLLLDGSRDAPTTVVLLDEEPGHLASGLTFDYHGEVEGDGDNDEHVIKSREQECEEPINNTLEFDTQKRQRKCGGFESSTACESELCAFLADQFVEFHEREVKREEREMERERRQALFDAERLKQMQEWERERREMEDVKRREAERQEAERQERELRYRMMEHQRESLERERQQERDEKMERKRMEWREKMESRAMQHQAAMMQIQLQIAQCLQNSVTVVSGAVSQLAGEGNDVTGQPCSNNSFLSQLLQSLQTHGTGTAHYGDYRGIGESSDSHFDVDG